MDEIIADLEKNGDGFVKAMWCGDEACEDKVKEVTAVCHLKIRNRFLMYVYAVENQRKKWFTGAKLINLTKTKPSGRNKSL